MVDWADGDGPGRGCSLFDMKLAASDNVLYSVEDAERKDLAYMVENSCISCNRLLERAEVKIVPPRYVQERDEYVRRGAVSRRLMCARCYNALKSVTRRRVRVRDTPASRKSWIIGGIVHNLLLKN